MKIDIKSNVDIQTEITFKVTESEARALDALVGYGVKPFLEVFYKHMGQYYLKPYEKGLISLFDTVKREVRPGLRDIEQLKALINNRNK